MIVFLVVLVLFTIVCVSLFSEFEYLSHHLFGKRLLTRFIICLICLLTSLQVVTSFLCYVVGGVWDLIVSVPDRFPLFFVCGVCFTTATSYVTQNKRGDKYLELHVTLRKSHRRHSAIRQS